jgi:hypothetical protein
MQTDTYNSATSASISFVLSRATQSVSWSPTTAVTTNQSPLTPSALASTSGNGALTYSVTSAGSTGCTVNSSTAGLTFTSAGSCVVRATAAQTSQYGSATVDVTFVITALTCAQGGICVVGNTGPGGGIVFYVGSSTINSATGISSGGKYLEYGSLVSKTFSCWGERITERRTFGTGAQNTKETTSICGQTNGAAYYAANLTEGGKSDWFLPSSGELEVMFNSRSSTGISASGVYLSSTDTNTNSAMTVDFGLNAKLAALYRDTPLNVRPIRAFG